MCRRISCHWISRRDKHLRRLFRNFKLGRYWWNYISSNIQWMFAISFFHFFWMYLHFYKVKTLCNQTLWNEQSHFELILSAIFCMNINFESQSKLKTMFDSIFAQPRDKILNIFFLTIWHVFWCIVFFWLTTH
jgi:hypothetical protein